MIMQTVRFTALYARFSYDDGIDATAEVLNIRSHFYRTMLIQTDSQTADSMLMTVTQEPISTDLILSV